MAAVTSEQSSDRRCFVSGTTNVPAPNPKLYRTSDIYFASYLASLDFSLVTTERGQAPDGGTKVVFVFNVPEGELPKLKASFFGGTGTVKVRKFVDNLRSLKSLCFT
jgi:hypothetical protein